MLSRSKSLFGLSKGKSTLSHVHLRREPRGRADCLRKMRKVALTSHFVGDSADILKCAHSQYISRYTLSFVEQIRLLTKRRSTNTANTNKRIQSVSAHIVQQTYK